MSRQFVTTTEISVSHGFYTSGNSSDFVLKPTSDTSQLMRRYRLLFGAKSKYSLADYVLLQETVSGTPLIELPTTYQLRFALELKNNALMNFSELPDLGPREVFFFENQPAGNQLYDTTPEKMDLVGEQFSWEGITAGTVQVRAEHVDTGEQVTFDTFTEIDAITTLNVVKVRLQLAGLPVGRYRLYRDAQVNHDKEIYFDPNLSGRDTWGVLHLTESAGLDIISGYQLAFNASERRWKYYLVLKGNQGSSTYTVNDATLIGPLTFEEQSVVNPPYPLSSADQKIMDTLSGVYAGATVQVMVSTQSIQYREAPRANIQLNRVTPNGGNPPIVLSIIKNLPNPDCSIPHAGVIVSVDPPG